MLKVNECIFGYLLCVLYFGVKLFVDIFGLIFLYLVIVKVFNIEL